MTTTADPTTRRLTGAAASTFRAHLDLLGPLPALDGSRLIAMTAAAGLTGRGGAAFPVGRKLAGVQAAGRGVVVGNGAEGEPASSKDRALLAQAPHLVLDGLALTARAVGAARAYLYAPQDLLDGPIARALRERRDDVRVRTVEAVDTFVAGQSSAVVAAINGSRPVPTMAPPYVHQRGVAGRPTLVQNVETLAQLALLARYGPDGSGASARSDEPGTRLVTVSGEVRSPGVYEVAGGTAAGLGARPRRRDLDTGAGAPDRRLPRRLGALELSDDDPAVRACGTRALRRGPGGRGCRRAERRAVRRAGRRRDR